ncbi:MAG: UDP-N-acetylmuramate--L-alanine ligase [Candidatus Paceibacterota bacterium]|jgi:UDP-N-acetylmuramate--alanine ligase
MDLDKVKKIHFIGIGGIGLSAIAKLMKKKGKDVSGSDLARSLMTEKLEKMGIKISIGQSEQNIASDVDLVIYTMAAAKDNPELKKARAMNIEAISYPESLGMVFNKKFGIAVCGTHGKSTTTAMAGLLLDDAGIDPTVLVGSIVPRFDSNLRVGSGKHMIIEACEYERAFLNYYPEMIILNNIELDHTDYYKDIDDFRSAFEVFVGHLPEDGVLIANGDDIEISKIKYQISKIRNRNIKILNFGLDKSNDVMGYDIVPGEGKTEFKVSFRGKDLGEFVLKIPGSFNVYNALAAATLGLELNIPVDIIKRSLSDYSGIWRRFEIKGNYHPASAPEELWQGKGALVISDYAHHPTAVNSTIKAAREFYPGRRIFAVFQPHQHNRTKRLYNDFLNSFNSADLVILSEIFDVAGREEKGDQNVSSLNLANDIRDQNKDLEDRVFYAKDLSETRKLIDEKIRPDDILLVMGAGDIYKIADDLIKK